MKKQFENQEPPEGYHYIFRKCITLRNGERICKEKGAFKILVKD